MAARFSRGPDYPFSTTSGDTTEFSLHTHQTVLKRIQCRFSIFPTLYRAPWPPGAERSRETTLFGRVRISPPRGSTRDARAI
jgi:hypothetical protein